MPPELSSLTKEQLAERLVESNAKLIDANFKIHRLEDRISWFERQMFGRKSERFIPANSNQLRLDLGASIIAPAIAEVKTENIAYTRAKANKKEDARQPVRMPLPAHLRREVNRILPQGDLSDKVKIGEEVSEYLEEKPGDVYVVQTIREIYATKGKPDAGVIIADLPSRALPKFNVGAFMLSLIIIRKYVDHLPIFRQRKIYLRNGLDLKESTIHGWIKAASELLEPLYERMMATLLARSYLQSDDTGFKVLEERDAGRKTPFGYMWVYQDPVDKLVLFSYAPRRDKANPESILKNYQGYLQCDGLQHYDSIGKRNNVTLLNCWAHARRKFEAALDNNFEKANWMMCKIQSLYEVERIARQGKYSHDERYQIREKKSVPVLKEIKDWLTNELSAADFLPKSLFGEAVQYTLARMENLSRYSNEGRLEIDNNLAENSIRPIVLGRKNYLFAATHESAQRAAIFYSILATCRHLEINPQEYLADVLNRIGNHPINRIDELMPGRWKENKLQATESSANLA